MSWWCDGRHRVFVLHWTSSDIHILERFSIRVNPAAIDFLLIALSVACSFSGLAVRSFFVAADNPDL